MGPSDGEQGPQTNDKRTAQPHYEARVALFRQLAVTFIISTRRRGETRIKCAQARFYNLVGDIPDDRWNTGHSSNEEPVAGDVRSEITEDRFDTCFGNTKQQRVELTREQIAESRLKHRQRQPLCQRWGVDLPREK